MTLVGLRNTFAAVVCLAAATGPLSPAHAGKLKPGQWDIGGMAQICLEADGSWFGTNPINFGGFWQATPQPNTNKYIIYGQSFHTEAVDLTLESMDVLGNLQANWTEWQFAKQGIYHGQAQMTFVKPNCDHSG